MKACIVIPGFAGSELFDDKPDGQRFWVEGPRLVLEGVRKMALAPDGEQPSESFGAPFVNGQPMDQYYGNLARRLYADLHPLGYDVWTFGFDWRKRLSLAAAKLVELIRRESSPSQPCSVVAHSMGGIVTRLAWQQLSLADEQNLVRRVVTLGTPHRGTYAPVRVWCLGDDTIEEIATLQDRARWALGPSYFIIPPTIPDRAGFSRLFSTWPGLYSLLPFADAQGVSEDMHRLQLYDAGRYPEDRGVNQTWLTFARNTVQDALLLPSAMPPASVLTCVAGTGHATPNRLVDPLMLGSMTALGLTDEGDGTVAVASALVAGRPHVTVHANHGALTLTDLVLDRVAGWVLEERPDPQPIPVPVVVPGTATTRINPPPFVGDPPYLKIAPNGTASQPPSETLSYFASAVSGSSGGGGGMFHVSIAWQQTNRKVGAWTENFWVDQADVGLAIEDGKALAKALRLFKGRQTNYTEVLATRVMGADLLPVSPLVDSEVYAFKTNTDVAAEDVSDQPQASIHCQLYAGSRRTKQNFKGVQDDFIKAGGLLDFTSTKLKDAKDAVLNVLKTRPFRLRMLKEANLKKPIRTLTQAGVLEVAGHAFPADSKIRISGAKSNQYMNRVWNVFPLDPADANKVQIARFNPPTPFIPLDGENPTARLQQYEFLAITNMYMIGCTIHKIGGPKLQHKGRDTKKRT